MKNLRYVVAVIIVAAAGWLAWQSTLPAPTLVGPGGDTPLAKELDDQAADRIKVSFEFSEDDISLYNFDWAEGVTALFVSHAVIESRNQSFVTEDYGDLGVLVTEINSVKNGADNRYWQYWVNGEQPQIAANRYILQPGDNLEWKFMSSEY